MTEFTERILRVFQTLKREDIANLLMEMGKTTIAVSMILAVITANPLLIVTFLMGTGFMLASWGIRLS